MSLTTAGSATYEDSEILQTKKKNDALTERISERSAVVSQSPEENEIPTIRVEATSPGRNANAFREAAQGYAGGPPDRLPLPGCAPVPHPQLLVPWPSI